MFTSKRHANVFNRVDFPEPDGPIYSNHTYICQRKLKKMLPITAHNPPVIAPLTFLMRIFRFPRESLLRLNR